MYLDTRNNNKVIILKDGSNSSFSVVKNLKDGKRYLVEKRYLRELKTNMHP